PTPAPDLSRRDSLPPGGGGSGRGGRTATHRALRSLEPGSALHAEAVAVEVVVPAGGADQSPRRLRLHPAVAVPAVPDAVPGAHGPLPAFADQNAELPHRSAEAAWIHTALPAPLEALAVPR